MFFSYLRAIYDFHANFRQKLSNISHHIKHTKDLHQKKRIFSAWNREIYDRNKKLAYFNISKASKIKRNIFEEWKIVVSNILLRKKNLKKLSNFHQKKTVIVYFDKWITKFNERRSVKLFFKNQRLKYLRVWFEVWRKIRCRNFVVTMMDKRRNMNFLQNSFDFLKENVIRKNNKREFCNEIRKKIMMGKFFRILKKFTENNKRLQEY